jgi:3-isopropylmalate/(R)-2-methylmalate dehydratase small subunit
MTQPTVTIPQEPLQGNSPPIIAQIRGRGIPLRGNDIDTDRILPAQFMKTLTFAGLEKYLFYNERKLLGSRVHPFDDPRFQGAKILIVNKNFGCGSSREHAPQALKRWGISAIVGESFAEIFFGNCLKIGVPCCTAGEEEVRTLMEWVETHPEEELLLSVEDLKLTYPGGEITLRIPPSARERFLNGTWDPLQVLMEGAQGIEQTITRLPYLRWSRG